MADVTKKRPWILIAAGMGLALLVGVCIFIATQFGGSGPDTESTTSGSSAGVIAVIAILCTIAAQRHGNSPKK